MAFMVFTQALFPAIVLSMCNLILVSSLKTGILRDAPSVDIDAVIKAGATNFRSIIDEEDLPSVVAVYANSVRNVFYLVAAMVVMSGIFIRGIGWQDLRKSTVNEPVAEQSTEVEENEEKSGQKDCN